MKKYLAFFGAFNPPTIAHVNLAKLAMEQTGHDGVIFVPSKRDYVLKTQGKESCFSDEQRLWMLRRICDSEANLCCSSHDIRMPKQPHTYDTLRWLRDEDQIHPTLLIGDDQFFTMKTKWINVREIASEFGIVVLTRCDDDGDMIQQMFEQDPFYQALAPYVTIVTTPIEYNRISSSEVRRYAGIVRNGLAQLRKMVPESVYSTIKEDILR